MKRFIALTFLLILSFQINAQENFQWKGLKLGISSVEESKNVLGKPKKDKIEKGKFDKSVTADLRNQMNFRSLQYQKLDGHKLVNLLFLNDKLFSIDLVPEKKKMTAATLSELFVSDFLFLEGLSKEMNFGDYEGQKESTVPKVYPSDYFMLNVKKDRIILATIENQSWKAFWRDINRKPTIEMFPGYVTSIKILTRDMSQK